MLRYHDITKCDMKNGEGLRVVLWLSGCSHHCKNCHNPITWDPNDGLEFDGDALNEIYEEMDKSYINGITLSGGDPLFIDNNSEVFELLHRIKSRYPDKSIWVYTGYTFEEIISNDDLCDMLVYIDVLVDGRYVDKLRDESYPWAGSTNQRVINVKKSLLLGEVCLYEAH